MKFKRFIENESPPPVSDEIEISNGVLSKLPASLEPIKMDIAVFIRVMEYARENAKTDQELHELAERASALSRDKILTMEEYELLVKDLRRLPDDPNSAPTADLPPPSDSFGGEPISGT